MRFQKISSIRFRQVHIPWKQILAVVILLMAFVFFRSERHEMASIIPNLERANAWWVAAGVLIAFVYVALQSLMYMASFRTMGLKIGFGDAIELFLKRNFLSIFLPVGGVSSLAYTPSQLRKKDFNMTQVHQAGAVYGFVGLLTVFIVGIPVILYSAFHGQSIRDSWLAIVVLGIILFLLFFVVYSFRKKNRVYRWFSFHFPRLVAQSDSLFQGSVDQKFFYLTVFISTVIEFCGIFHAFVAMYALGVQASFEAAAIGYTISVLLMIVSPFLRGLGAVEFTMIYVFTRYGYTHSQGLGITLLYRIFEFWLPVFFGIFAFLWRGRKLLARILPALAIFTLGMVNIISVITPPLIDRFRLERIYLPVEAMHFSKITVLILGIALLITSAYLIKGLKTAWTFAVVFAVLSLFGNILKALDYEEAILALVTILLLIYSRDQYRLRTNRKSVRQGFSVFFIVLFSVMIFNFLSFYCISERHFGMDFTWKQSLYYTLYSFLLFNDNGLVPQTHFAQDFKDINFFLGFVSWIFLLLAFFRTKRYEHADEKDFGKALEIVKEYGNSALDYFKTTDDKKLFFSEYSEGFIAYNVARNFAVVLEEPVAEEEDKADIISEFEAFCRKNGLKSAYYRVGEDSLYHFLPSRKQKLWIGQEAIVDVQQFTLQGKDRKSLRNGLNSLSKKGYTAELLAAPQTDGILDDLKSVSDEWLAEFNKTEMVFAEGKFERDVLRHQDIIVVRNENGKTDTFMNIIPDYAPDEMTYDMIRRTRESVGGSMDAAIVKLIEVARTKGMKFVNLGLTPLAGNDQPDNIAEQVMKFAYHRLESFKHYQTMRSFKEKYADIWENKYLVYGNDMELLQLPAALSNVMRPNSEKKNS